MPRGVTNPNFMNGVPEMLVLGLLREKKEMYGYEIVQAIRNRSDSMIAIGEGVVYPLLHALERGGALRARRQTVGGRGRIYYRLTPEGARRLLTLAKEWSRVGSGVRKVLAGLTGP